MKSIASLEITMAKELLAALQSQNIAAQLQPVTDESGLDLCEIQVADEQFDAACDAAEAWQTERDTARAVKSKQFCPQCRSLEMAWVPHDKFGHVRKCTGCGHEYILPGDG